jgi:2,4'-dihydroxyacetophenone dioxygenase
MRQESDRFEGGPGLRTKRALALPELFIEKPACDGAEYLMPFTETVKVRPLWICLQQNMWANILVAEGAGMVNRHYHPHPVYAYTISGRWGYLEHDWVAGAGDVLYEPPGTAHTLVTYESDAPAQIFFVVQGPLLWLDESGAVSGQYDAFDFYANAREHFAGTRLGAEYVDGLLR